MSKDNAIRRIAADLGLFGWQFVDYRIPADCKQHMERDQAATRLTPVHVGDAAIQIALIGMRVENWP